MIGTSGIPIQENNARFGDDDQIREHPNPNENIILSLVHWPTT